MKRTEPKSIAEIIDEVIRSQGLDGEMAGRRICFAWSDVVGPGIAKATSRRYVDGTTLHVHISSAALKNDLQYMKSTLIGRLNEAAGSEVINNIVFH